MFEKLLNLKFFKKAYETLKLLKKCDILHINDYSVIEEILDLHEANTNDADKYNKDYLEAQDELYYIFKELESDKMLYFINMVEGWKHKPTKPTKFEHNIYFITLSPPPTYDPLLLIKTTGDLITHQNTFKMYGVFELSTTNDNFHTHFFIEFNNTRGLELLKKKLNIGNGKTPIYSNSLEKMKNGNQLLLKMRYLHKADKKNVGFINKADFNYFEQLTGDKVLTHFTQREYKGNIYNI